MALIELKDTSGNYHWLSDSEHRYTKVRALGYCDGKFGYFRFDTGRELQVSLETFIDFWHRKDRVIYDWKG